MDSALDRVYLSIAFTVKRFQHPETSGGPQYREQLYISEEAQNAAVNNIHLTLCVQLGL